VATCSSPAADPSTCAPGPSCSAGSLAENAAAFFEAAFRTDVQDAAQRVKCPTLVLHANKDKAVHVEEGRRLASLIPGPVSSNSTAANHMLLPEEAAWARFLEEARSFLGTPRAQDGIAEKLTSLTERERQVLEGIARGLDNGEIAAGSRSPKRRCATM